MPREPEDGTCQPGIPAGADGASSGARISIREGPPPAQEFAVLTHQLAHELLHHCKDRPQSPKVRETEVEAVAFVVSQAVGFNTGTAANYIQLYDGKAETLAASLDRIRHVAAEIIAALSAAREQARAA